MLSLPALCEIKDDFAETSLSKDLVIKKVEPASITDDFAEKTLDKNLKIKISDYEPIKDTFAESNKTKNIAIRKYSTPEEILPKVTQKFVRKQVIIDESSSTKVVVRISKYFTTKSKVDEGTDVEFQTVDDVKISNKMYPKGSIVKARVETIAQNGTMGVPSDLVVGNFMLDNIPLCGEINKVGANRSLWVYPCVCGLLYFFCAGLLFIPIRGGHAKIRPSETFTLYAK